MPSTDIKILITIQSWHSTSSIKTVDDCRVIIIWQVKIRLLNIQPNLSDFGIRTECIDSVDIRLGQIEFETGRVTAL